MQHESFEERKEAEWRNQAGAKPNLCRTCRHWALNESMAGLGFCANTEVHLRLFPQELRTAQNFGCIFHEPGRFSSIYSPEESARILGDYSDFIRQSREGRP